MIINLHPINRIHSIIFKINLCQNLHNTKFYFYQNHLSLISYIIYLSYKIILISINFVTTNLFLLKLTSMINALVDKAIERSNSKLEGH